MSELRAATISDLAGTGPVDLTAQKGAKAHMRLDMPSGTATFSFNIASLTDNGVGTFDANLTSAMANLSAAVPSACGTSNQRASTVMTPDTSTVRCLATNNNATAVDSGNFQFSIVGDLA